MENPNAAVFVFNFIFILIGGCLLSIGIIYTLSIDQLSSVIPESFSHLQLSPVLTISVGVTSFILATFGFITSFYRKRCFYISFLILLSVIFTFQVSVGLYILLQANNEDELLEGVDTTLVKLFTDGGNNIGSIQASLRCCGTSGPTFWNETLDKPFPESCCVNTVCSNVFTKGCQSAIVDFLLDAFRTLGVALLAFSIVEPIVISLTCYLIKKKRIGRGGYYWEEESEKWSM